MKETSNLRGRKSSRFEKIQANFPRPSFRPTLPSNRRFCFPRAGGTPAHHHRPFNRGLPRTWLSQIWHERALQKIQYASATFLFLFSFFSHFFSLFFFCVFLYLFFLFFFSFFVFFHLYPLNTLRFTLYYKSRPLERLILVQGSHATEIEAPLRDNT